MDNIFIHGNREIDHKEPYPLDDSVVTIPGYEQSCRDPY